MLHNRSTSREWVADFIDNVILVNNGEQIKAIILALDVVDWLVWVLGFFWFILDF